MMRHRITAVKFGPHSVSLKVDGEKVWDRVQVAPRVPMVGHYNLHKPVVRVDQKISDPKERKSLIIHEAVERNDRVRHGLEPHPAHRVAEVTERHFARHQLHMSRSDWRRYGTNVECCFRQNRREGERRRR